MDTHRSLPRAEGGQHKHTAKEGNRGTEEATESHHLIADSISDIKTSDAPAVRMRTGDHAQTGSHGSQGAQAERWRAEQKKLVDEGKYDEALNMGIDDLRATSGNRYDQHLDEMFDNLPKRSNGNVDWGLLKRKE